MRKILLLVVAVLFSVSVQAQLDLNYQWAAVLKSDNGGTNKGTNGIATVVTNADNDLFVFGQFGSLSLSGDDYKQAIYNHYDANDVLTTKATPDGSLPTNLTSSNNDFLLYKMGKDGKIIWQLTSDRGYLDHTNSTIAATADGGAIMALKLKHLKANLFGENYLIRFIENDGSKKPFEWTYPSEQKEIFQGLLVKVSADGKIQWMKHIPVDYAPVGSEKAPAVTDAVYFGGIAVDEAGNIYLGGRHVKTITFEKGDGSKVDITPQNTVGWTGDSQTSRGDMFLVKLDSDGNYVWNLTASGVVTYQGISDMDYNSGKLYIYGNIQGDDNLTTKLGDVTIQPTAKADCYTARIDVSAAPQVDWVKHIKAQPYDTKGGRNKLTSINYQDGIVLVSGATNAIIAEADGTVLGTVTSNQLKGYVIKQNAETGNIEAIYIDDVAGIGEIENAYLVNNKIYALGHILGTAFIYDTDANLENANKTTVFTSGSATTISSSLIEDQFIVVGRGQSQANILKDGVLTNLGTSFPAFSAIFASFQVEELGTSLAEDTQQGDFAVYGGYGQITIESSIEKDVTIYNVYGQVAKIVSVQEGLNVVDNLVSGVYIVAGNKVLVR